METGYFALWRKYIRSDLFLNEGLWKLWCLCMSRANWEENSVKLDGVVEPVQLKPGQFITGRFELHGAYHQWRRGYKKRFPSARTTWRWLKVLEKMQFLTIKSKSKFSIITMANWPTEQLEKQKVSSRCPADDHRETLSNHYKEGGKPPPKEKSKKDKGDSRSCEGCLKPFIPRMAWHTFCDDCFKPGVKGGVRPQSYPRCQGCGTESSSVIDGFCPFCESKEIAQ